MSHWATFLVHFFYTLLFPVFAPFVHRQTTFAMYLLGLIGMLVFTFTLSLGYIWLVFITTGILG